MRGREGGGGRRAALLRPREGLQPRLHPPPPGPPGPALHPPAAAADDGHSLVAQRREHLAHAHVQGRVQAAGRPGCSRGVRKVSVAAAAARLDNPHALHLPWTALSLHLPRLPPCSSSPHLDTMDSCATGMSASGNMSISGIKVPAQERRAHARVAVLGRAPAARRVAQRAQRARRTVVIAALGVLAALDTRALHTACAARRGGTALDPATAAEHILQPQHWPHSWPHSCLLARPPWAYLEQGLHLVRQLGAARCRVLELVRPGGEAQGRLGTAVGSSRSQQRAAWATAPCQAPHALPRTREGSRDSRRSGQGLRPTTPSPRAPLQQAQGLGVWVAGQPHACTAHGVAPRQAATPQTCHRCLPQCPDTTSSALGRSGSDFGHSLRNWVSGVCPGPPITGKGPPAGVRAAGRSQAAAGGQRRAAGGSGGRGAKTHTPP